MGLGRNLGIHLGLSTRDLSGHGAFQKGPEDGRAGLSFWPVRNPDGLFELGMRGDLLFPTGFRKQEVYYDELSESYQQLPAFSLKQNAGEFFGGLALHPSPAAELNAYCGYFSTADKQEQAFRWGVGAFLAPFGSSVAAEFGYGQSFTRVGSIPHTQVISSGLALRLPYQFTVVPGFSADLTDEPRYGASIALRFSTGLPRALFPEPEDLEPVIRRFAGTVLVPPPLTDIPLTNAESLWQSLREQIAVSFESVEELPTLDRPGFPYDPSSEPKFWQTMQALALDYPLTRWVLITEVEKEDITRKGVDVPYLVAHPTWVAECALRVRLVDLVSMSVETDRHISAQATYRYAPRIALVSTSENGPLSSARSRELAQEAYRLAGREIALSLPNADE